MEIQDKIYQNLTRAEYESIKAVNQSTLKHFRRSPAHAREYILHPPQPTDAMDNGNAIHCAVLEPMRFNSEYVVAPDCDRRTVAGKTAWKEFEEANSGKSIIRADDMLMCRAIAERCYSDPIVNQLLSGAGSRELSVVWTDAETGLRCKSRLDRVVKWHDWTVVVDLKSCKDASYDAFAKQCANLGYHEQAAFYLEGLNALAPMPRRFMFIAVEKEPPYCIAVYELEEDSLNCGRFEFRTHLNQYAECLKTDVWPGYQSGITPIQIPSWAMTGEEVAYAV